jgi:squalene-hopene/tetraprenyl-beta-curcumene cyclase
MSERIARTTKNQAVSLWAEGQRVWAMFEEESAQIHGFDELKRSEYFYILDRAADGVNLYTYFPFLFRHAFPELRRDALRKLSLMGLFYLYHFLIDDVAIDEKAGRPSRLAILVSDGFRLKAMEILGSLYGSRPFPWAYHRSLHREYTAAMLLEAKYHDGILNEYTREDMFRISAGKSAMAKIILIALCNITNRDDYIKPLTRSLNYYYIGDQLFDDFRDWKKDLRAGRYSYFITQVINSCKLGGKLESLDSNQFIELVGKHIYFSGAADPYLNDVISQWEEARLCLSRVNCPDWVRFLASLQTGARNLRSNIAKQSRQVLLQPSKYDYSLTLQSEKPKFQDPESRKLSAVRHPILSVSPCVSASAERAVGFLQKRYSPKTGFEDFIVFGESLPIWVNAYVGIALKNWSGRVKRRSQARRAAINRLVNKIAEGLMPMQKKNGWAANTSAPVDADTTAWATMFLLKLGAIGGHAITQCQRSLMGFRRPDMGFGTYLRDAMGAGFEAYSESHVEVTAVVLEALLMTGLAPDDEIVSGGLRFITAAKENNGLWQAYWWDGRMYATYHCLRAQYLCGRPLRNIDRDKTIESILSLQAEDGSWGGQTKGGNSVFETALALECLLLLGNCIENGAEFKRGVAWLLNSQGPGGDWDSFPMMRVPDGSDSKPWTQENWVLDSLNNVGALIRDQNNFFTTATVVNALTWCLDQAGDFSLVAQLKHSLRSAAA